jgi:urease accessory protein
MDANTEDYLLLLLADGNLPTGAFVASSGLESFVTHGFFNSSHDLDSMINFVRDSVGSYARSALPFVSDTHKIVSRVVGNSITNDTVTRIKALDDLYEAMTLNHVARRASKAQGVALLTLYSKGFSKPAFLSVQSDKSQQARDTAMASLVERYKLLIRNEETHGHLPICWSLLTAALGLSLGEPNPSSARNFFFYKISKNAANIYISSFTLAVSYQLQFVSI